MRLLAALQLAAADVEGEVAHPDLVARARRTAAALEDVLQPQQQLARLERLGDVVVDADLQALDALLGLGRAVSMQIGMLEIDLRSRASSRPLSPGIITSRMTTSKARPRMDARAVAASVAVVTRKPFSNR